MDVGKKYYIGDGVYLEYDGWQIELSTQSGNTIYVEPPVFRVMLEVLASSKNDYQLILEASKADV